MIYTLPEWNEKFHSTDEEGDYQCPTPELVAAKELYEQWREVFSLTMLFLDALPENNVAEATKGLIQENIMIVSPKIMSAAGDTLYIIKMENASIIRTNCRQLMDQVIFAGFDAEVGENYVEVIRDATDKFKLLFRVWVAKFMKDDCDDDWGLY